MSPGADQLEVADVQAVDLSAFPLIAFFVSTVEDRACEGALLMNSGFHTLEYAVQRSAEHSRASRRTTGAVMPRKTPSSTCLKYQR